MHISDNSFKNLLLLWKVLSKQRKIQCTALVFLSAAGAIAELFSLGALIPFISTIISPSAITNLQRNQYLPGILKQLDNGNLLLFITAAVVFLILLSLLLRLLLSWSSAKIIFGIGNDISVMIFEVITNQDYSIHTERNSSEVIDLLTTKLDNVIYGTILPAINISSSLALIIIIGGGLLYSSLHISSPIIIGFIFAYFLISKFNKRKIAEISKTTAQHSPIYVQNIQETLGSIKEVILYNAQQFFLEKNKNISKKLLKAKGDGSFISSYPRVLMESMAMILIITSTYIFSSSIEDPSTVLPLLAILAIGAQKLLPLFQQNYVGLTHINSGKNNLIDILEVIYKRKVSTAYDNSNPIEFTRLIELHDISYKYPTAKVNTFVNLNLSICKGTKVGIIGETGIGKSTLIDIILGLKKPSSGSLSIDGKIIDENNSKSWQAKVSQVPQNIFLIDDTIASNIAFSRHKDDIDFDKIKNACKISYSNSFIEDLELKYDTMVGEGGIRLSGGEKQRLGIARAIYKNSEFVVFDEATSALDISTEYEVMQAIYENCRNVTLLIIAHRLSTLQSCDKIYKIESGKAIEVDKNELFRKL